MTDHADPMTLLSRGLDLLDGAFRGFQAIGDDAAAMRIAAAELRLRPILPNVAVGRVTPDTFDSDAPPAGHGVQS